VLVCGIESTCDETACSLVVDGKRVLAEVIASSAESHRPYGGVFTEVASRAHSLQMIPVVDAAICKAGISFKEIDLIAVAHGPGLLGSLLIGLSCAKTLSWAWDVPFVGVNHIEAHLYAAMMGQEPLFPSLGVVISGGHTCLIKIHSIGSYELLGTTVDDAVGEAFDKVASLLGLPYPGGPALEQLAKGGIARFPLKAGSVKQNPFYFSFSGLKTAVLYTIRQSASFSKQDQADLAASFQDVAIQDILDKTKKAASTFECKAIYFGGGVSCNQKLRKEASLSLPWPLFWPSKGLSTDNATMIAGLGFHLFQRKGRGDDFDLEPRPRIPFHIWNGSASTSSP